MAAGVAEKPAMTPFPGSRQNTTQVRQKTSHARDAVLSQYGVVRQESESLCRPLATEDYCIQSMPDVSPPKWHLAHTSWFFETFLLIPFFSGYQRFHPQFEYLFNSYYEAVGAQFPRPQRGMLSRPTVEEVYRYRAHVDAAMAELIHSADEEQWEEIAGRVTLGLHHEQQHQELFLTDLKHVFSVNPLRPAYREPSAMPRQGRSVPLEWIDYPGGVVQIGHHGEGFAYDNESPRHRVYLQPYALGSRLVTNGEYLEFMEAGGYGQPEFWLSDGWRTARERRWEAPLYWEKQDGRWRHMTLSGMQPVDEHAPVCHVSFYEAHAYACWAGKRLATEAEWERAAAEQDVAGNLRESGALHPVPADMGTVPLQMFGDVWEWTQSAYAPYPGYRATPGALGEYNGKFMANQMVLRGGSFATPTAHIRATYRNFFYPRDRWQFSGFRLADDR